MKLRPGDPTKGISIPKDSDFEGQQDFITELPQDWGKQTLRWHKQNFVGTRTQEKGEVTRKTSNQTFL